MIKENSSEKPGQEFYLLAKAAELTGDFNTAIQLYKKAEKLGHDLVDDGGAADGAAVKEIRSQKTFEDLENSELGLFDPVVPTTHREQESRTHKSDSKKSKTNEIVNPSAGFKLILVDLQKPLCEHFAQHFSEWKSDVQVVCGRFEELAEFDCMVSAANSFGLMDGGVDAAITAFFGEQLMRRVQQHIIDNFDGEQPVGTSFIIETHNKKHPYLAHTPTMRVPYSIRGTDYVYLAMKAVLNAVRLHNRQTNVRPIRSIACTGLGTFYGKMEFPEAARQMALAYRNFLNVPKKISWQFASMRQEAVGYGGYEGLKKVGSAGADTLQSRKEISQAMYDLAQKTAHLNK